MKKFISISIAAIMMIALASVFVFADDKKSTTIATENTIALENYGYEEIFGSGWYVEDRGEKNGHKFSVCAPGGDEDC